MLRCNHPALNVLCNLFYRHHKKVLSWGDPSVKLRYSLEKEIFMENKNILLIFCKTYSAKPFMAHNKYENTCQESWRIHQSIQHFSDNLLSRTVRINRVNHPYNSSDNIIEINGTPYNIQWEGKYLIIVDNDRSRIDTLSPISESAELAITSYLAYLAKKEGVKQICFLLA